jgi:glycosyltransferase involved in cell wall biosynthesis
MPQFLDNANYIVVGPEEKQAPKIIRILTPKMKRIWELATGYGVDFAKIKSVDLPNVFHLGSISNEELNYLYSIADIVVMPNQQVDGDVEGFGLVAIEATLKSKVVMVSAIEGLVDAIHHKKNGILLASDYPRSWVSNINLFLGNKRLSAGFGIEAMKYSKTNFTIEVMLENYNNLFKKMVNNTSEFTEISNINPS